MPFRIVAEEEKDRIKEMYLAGFSLAQIALAVGCSATTVSKFLDKSGLRKIPVSTPTSLCWSCANAVPTACEWIRNRDASLAGKVYVERESVQDRIYSIQECPEYVKGDIPPVGC